MIIEKKHIEGLHAGKELIGHIVLDKLAIPETVKVTLLGKQLIPSSFNNYGHPEFTEEQYMLFLFKEDELNRIHGKYTPLEAEIYYEERIFDVPKSSFDSILGIKKSLQSLSDLHEMLINRKLYLKAYPSSRLNEFVIFGRFKLDQFGQIWTIHKHEENIMMYPNKVETYENFKMKNNSFSSAIDYFCIPKPNSICQCCGKLLSVDDIKNNPCIYVSGNYYHHSCYKVYEKFAEIDKLTRNLMDNVYKFSDYTFELLPNGYCRNECCSHIPWILFHTIDGDIIVGKRKRVLSIEWQENYKSFNMDELFSDENVTKWEENGKRGIHAWSKDKAYEYLDKVRKTVNPDYSKY